MQIEITIERSIPPNDWLRIANKRARVVAKIARIEWIDAAVRVTLPEPGRFFTKAHGFTELVAHG